MTILAHLVHILISLCASFAFQTSEFLDEMLLVALAHQIAHQHLFQLLHSNQPLLVLFDLLAAAVYDLPMSLCQFAPERFRLCHFALPEVSDSAKSFLSLLLLLPHAG